MSGRRPGPTPTVPIDAKEAIRQATPRWVMAMSVGLAWLTAVATALLYVQIGVAVDAWVLTAASLVGLIVLALVAAAAAGTGAWFSQRAASTAERRLRRAVVSRIFDVGVTGATRSGELLSLATEAVERATHYRAAFLGPILGALTTPLLVLGVMAITVDPVTAGWLALLVLLVPLLIGGFQRMVSPIGAAYRASQARLTAGFLEAIQALEMLVYARAAHRVEADLSARGEDHRRRLMRLLAGNQVLIFVVDAAFSLTIVVAAAAIAVTRIGSGDLSLGGGISVILLATLVIGPVDVVGQFFYIGIGGRAAQRQLITHLTKARPAQPSRDGYATPMVGGIVLDAVTVGWPDGPPVVADLSLRVAPGERVALVGPSGVGKSTVAALIQGDLTPQAGSVQVDGLDLAQAPPGQVRSRLAVVEQRTFLFQGSIADNLRLADPRATDDRLWQVLELAGLRAEVEAMPDKLDTQVGEHGALLSGGQSQRLAIARAWLRDAPILLLDEPTSQVDLAGEAGILAALDRLAEGRTVLMIAHRPGAILAADRVVTLQQAGRFA
ncbi:MAG: ABC transporter ATP-binding protein [Acidobacteriota bacterium]|nr:ABC transporter ATP-binding protein [Acidobacteriota bacterium]